MKLALLFVLVALCAACGQAVSADPSATASPRPTATVRPSATPTPAPDMRGCISALALALARHTHYVGGTSRKTDTASNTSQIDLFGETRLQQMISDQCGEFMDSALIAEMRSEYGFR